jgi:nitrate reductase molybdenum cofactor assembly chaperone
MQEELYDTLAKLLSYPERSPLCHPERREGPACRTEQSPLACHSEAASAAEESAVGSELARFPELVRSLSLYELQELFIQTFDLSPICSLEMGWHLFGENYDRGLLLVKMRQQLRAHGIPETTELPDHLTNALRLLPRMEHEAGAYFAEAIVLAALEKMLDAIRGKDNPYQHVLDAVRLAVRADFPQLPARLAVPAAVPELRVLAW